MKKSRKVCNERLYGVFIKPSFGGQPFLAYVFNGRGVHFSLAEAQLAQKSPELMPFNTEVVELVCAKRRRKGAK